VRAPLRVAVVASAIVATLAVGAPPSAAHPLGNFTVSTSSALTVRPDEVAISYVVDMAEIPAFRERRAIDVDADGSVDASEARRYAAATCAALRRGLEVRSDDRSVAVTVSGGPAVTFPAGAAGLSTLRLECAFAAALSSPIRQGSTTAIRFVDRNYADAVGWREVTATADGVTLERTDVPTRSATAALMSYPRDALPLEVRTASLRVTAGTTGVDEPAASNAEPALAPVPVGRNGGIISSLVTRDDLSPLLVLVMVVAALAVGALHALGPGHGKTLIGAYLIGAEGTVQQAVGVGVAVSLMHTASVLGLGAVVLTAERIVAPERVYPWLGLAAGALAVALGGGLLAARIRVLRHAGADQDQGGTHIHPHGTGAIGRRGLVALAFSGGALPSPTALLVFLGAVSVGRAALGLTLIAAFSVGLAASLIGVGIVTLRARDLLATRLSTHALRVLPALSAGLIVAMGIYVMLRGAAQL
jgi:nickel/cobalt exporter